MRTNMYFVHSRHMYNFTFTVMNTVQPLVDIITRTHEKAKMAFYSMNMPFTVNRRDSHNYSVFHSDQFLTLINKNSLWPSAQETVLQRHISCNSLEKQMIDR